MSKQKQYENHHELHLFCKRFTTDDGIHNGIGYPEIFYGKNFKKCLKEAHECGWKIKKKAATCPKCIKLK